MVNDWTPETNTEAHGLLSKEQRQAVEESGPPWLLFLGYGWAEVYACEWGGASTYRAIKPQPRPLTVAPEFWEAFPSVKHVARDKDGDVWAFAGNVEADSGCWVMYGEDDYLHIGLLCALIDPGTCDWHEAIAKRPEGV